MTESPPWLAELLSASPSDRQQLLQARPPEGLADDVRGLASEVLRELRVDVERATVLAEAAALLGDRQPDRFVRGLGRRALAHVRYLQSSYQEADDLYAEATESFRASGAEVEVGKTLSNSLQVRILLGHYEEAEAAAAEARRLLEQHGEELPLARLECNLGNLLHRSDRFEEAIESYESSLQALRRYDDPLSIAAALLNLGVCRIAIDDFNRALECFEELQRLCLDHDLPLPAAQADYNIAYLYYRRGEYTHAIELYLATEAHCRRSGDSLHQALCCLDLAELYLEVRLTKEGTRLATEANRLFLDLGMGYETSKAQVFMAIGASQEKRTVRSLNLLDSAHAGYEREGNPVWCATIDLYRGLTLLEAGRAIEAQREGERALAFFLEQGHTARVVQCELLVARTQLARGATSEARRLCDSALERSQQHNLRDLLYQGHFISGQIEERDGNPEAALAAHRQAHGLLEGSPSHPRSDPLQITLVADNLEVYEHLVWHSVGTSSKVPEEEVFSIIEDAKARGMAELIAFKPPALPASLSHRSELVMEMRQLRQELNWYSFQIDRAELATAAGPATGDGGAASSRRIDELRSRAREGEDRLLETLSQLRADDRDFFSLQMGGAVDVESIRASMPPNADMLVFYEARGTIFGLTVGHRDLHIEAVSTVGKVHEIQSRLQFQLSRFFLGPAHVVRFHEDIERETSAHLSELYEELIRPVRSRLSGDELIIVPHGSLHNIPFHALRGDGCYLIDDFAISYAPSARVYRMCCRRPTKQAQPDLRPSPSADSSLHIRDEQGTIKRSLPSSSVIVDKDAPGKKLRELGYQAGRVHVASGGLNRRDNPMFSEIQLGDSSVAIFDLYQLDLSSELVVLSGCGSSLTSVDNGDEFVSLTRGLLYAGAESVVTMLWNTPSESTASFLGSFYRELENVDNRAVALQRAMLAVRCDFPHPFYWAPFHLSGKSSARSAAAAGPTARFETQAARAGRAS